MSALVNDSQADEIVSQLAARLQEVREAKGLSMNQLAGLAGLDQVAISRIEKGDRSPGLRTVLKIANALEIRLSEELQALGH